MLFFYYHLVLFCDRVLEYESNTYFFKEKYQKNFFMIFQNHSKKLST